jgi:hypothetical protein
MMRNRRSVPWGLFSIASTAEQQDQITPAVGK